MSDARFAALRARVVQALDRDVAPWSPAIAALLRERVAPCLALVPTLNDQAACGCFGGAPRLPDDLDWPLSDRGEHMSYLGVLDLARLAAAGSGSLRPRLPARGVLWFFVEYLGSAAEPVRLRCVHRDVELGALSERTLPPGALVCDIEELSELEQVLVAAEASISVPTSVREVTRLVKRASEKDARIILDELLFGIEPEGAIGQLGGWADSHGDTDLYRALALTDLERPELVYSDYWDTVEDYQAAIAKFPALAKEYRRKRRGVTWLLENAAVIAERASGWTMLLRLDSNQAMRLCINDADPLFVFVRGLDLESADFESATGRVLQG